MKIIVVEDVPYLFKFYNENIEEFVDLIGDAYVDEYGEYCAADNAHSLIELGARAERDGLLVFQLPNSGDFVKFIVLKSEKVFMHKFETKNNSSISKKLKAKK